MKYFQSFLSALVLGLMLASCSPKLSPFTENVYNEFGKSDNELSKIQFYLSNDIVLYRDYGNTKSSIVDGKIRMVDGRKIEEVIFKKGTPGVFVFSPKRDRIAISFDESDDKYLMFGPSGKMSGRFVLLAKEWKKRKGKITYADKVWNTPDDSAFATLLVDLDKARKTKVKKTTASGRRVK